MEKVISYRVREYSVSEYIVEKYTVSLQDELEYQRSVQDKLQVSFGSVARKNISLSDRYQSNTVQFTSNLWNITGFQNYVKRECEKHEYEMPPVQTIEQFNCFLATHYFLHRATGFSEEFKELNQLNRKYIQWHNAYVSALKIAIAYGRTANRVTTRGMDSQELIRTMNWILADIGYLDSSEMDRNYVYDTGIQQFFEDIGFLGAPHIDNLDTAGKIQLFLRISGRILWDIRQNNILAEAEARKRLTDEISVIECMNVGQANCSLGFDKPNQMNPLAIFDVGAAGGRAVKKKLRQVTENGIVIISHYDRDHIAGCSHLSSDAKNRIWIIPEPRTSPTEAESKFHDYLIQKNCVILEDIDYTQKPFVPRTDILKLRNISIYRGNCISIDDEQSTNENARSLICLVEKEKAALLPADCLYREFPTSFSVDYLLVPHHSCCYTQDIINIDHTKLKTLIVCAGPDRGYKHPDITHIGRLGKGQCEVVYLMKHKECYFENKELIQDPQITLTEKWYTVYL